MAKVVYRSPIPVWGGGYLLVQHNFSLSSLRLEKDGGGGGVSSKHPVVQCLSLLVTGFISSEAFALLFCSEHALYFLFWNMDYSLSQQVVSFFSRACVVLLYMD
jgi:hypothetical protein